MAPPFFVIALYAQLRSPDMLSQGCRAAAPLLNRSRRLLCARGSPLWSQAKAPRALRASRLVCRAAVVSGRKHLQPPLVPACPLRRPGPPPESVVIVAPAFVERSCRALSLVWPYGACVASRDYSYHRRLGPRLRAALPALCLQDKAAVLADVRSIIAEQLGKTADEVGQSWGQD